MKRIYSFDVLKFIFAIEIALSHYNTYLPAAGTAVEFFFILSGFFLARKFYSFQNQKVEYRAYDYTKDHVKKLYMHYIFSLLIIFAYPVLKSIFFYFKNSSGIFTVKEVFYRLYNLIPEALMVQNVGIYPGGINYPLWQVCVVIVAGHFIYAMLKHNSSLTINVLCPATVILIYTFLGRIYTDKSVDMWGVAGPFYIPLLRGLAAMCIGAILFKVTNENLLKISNKFGALLLNIASIASMVLILFFGEYNRIYLILSCVIIFACAFPASWINLVLNRKIFKSFGTLSYAIYLNHAFLILLFTDVTYSLESHFGITSNKLILNICFVVILLLYSKLTVFITEKLQGKISKLFAKPE